MEKKKKVYQKSLGRIQEIDACVSVGQPSLLLHVQSDGIRLFIVFFRSFAMLIYMSLISLLSFSCVLFREIPGEAKDLYALCIRSAD